jgi:large subunit ribosomal protein L13
METNASECEVFDADGKMAGRLASIVAKHLLDRKSAVVINAEKAVLSGNKTSIVKDYKVKLHLQDKANPEHSPYLPRRPDMLLKHMIKGMLPYNRPRGKEAFRRLRVYPGVPEEFNKAKRIEIEAKNPKGLYTGYVTLKDLSMGLGYKTKQ